MGSSICHQQHQLEEDFSDPQTSLMTHYNNIYYETLEEVKEITNMEEDVSEDDTDIEALETIQEVSEIYDTSEQTDITETEFIDEDMGDFQTFNMNDIDILYSISKDVEKPIETIHDLIKECSKAEILDEEFDLSRETSENSTIVKDSNITNESQIYSDLYNLASEPLQKDFSISMVSHQITSPDIPEDYPQHHLIVSSVSHQQHQLEDDFSEPQTSMLTHYNNIYYETLAEVKEIDNMEEDVAEDDTDIEALETIQEVSEIYDTSEQTDITETEFVEDIADFPTLNLNDVDILDTISKDIHEPTLDKTKLLVESNKDAIADEPVDSEDARFELIPSLQCHFMTSLEYDGEKVPSHVAHQVSNENTEENDFLSQISHQANMIPQHEEMREVSETTPALQYQCQCEDTEDIADICNDEHTVNEEVTEKRAPQIEEDQAGLFEDSIEGNETPHDIENSSKLPHEEEISCIETKSASEPSEKEDQSSLNDTENEGAKQDDQSSATENSEKEGSIQSYKLQLTRIKELQKLVEDELEEFDTKRKVKSNLVQATETQIVNIVRGIEFRSEIKMTQFTEEEDIDPITEIDDTNTNEEIKDEEDVIENDDIEEEGQDISDSEEENLIHACCTLKKDNTVSISSNVINSQPQLCQEDPNITTEETDQDTSEDVKIEQIELNGQECPIDEMKRQNDLKLQLRTPPRKSVVLETKIRDKQLLDSLLCNLKETESIPDEEKKEKKPSILKPNKSSITLAASLNENVKKQSYRIKFRVKVNDKSSKESSVLRYLFGCFGGERLFLSNH